MIKKIALATAIILTFLASLWPPVVSAQMGGSLLASTGEIKSVARAEISNKFGIHILEPSDLDKAQELVNSTGGDWGWVTVVIREDDLNFDKWQGFFDQCREKHLIPLVRVATRTQGAFWEKPRAEDADRWADFLSSLNWPTQDQYVIIFNEPNHAKEWQGELNPRQYARILAAFAGKLKEKNPNFKILNAGLDLAAPNGRETMDAYRYMQEMKSEVPHVFELLDGWSSHSYPNHGFVGRPWETGRTSVRGYDWELWMLKNHFGLSRDLPVFITETGWPKNSGRYYDEITAATYLKNAFESVWLNDPRVIAVTPFVLNYPHDLFLAFSWFDAQGQPFPQYNLVKDMPKNRWWPKQTTRYQVKSVSLPSFLPANTSYKGKIVLINTGQSIWGDNGSLEIPAKTQDGLEVSGLVLGTNTKVKPGDKTEVEFTIKAKDSPGEYQFTWGDWPKQSLKVFPASIITEARYNIWERLLLKLKEVF
jgi:hypothetical protein